MPINILKEFNTLKTLVSGRLRGKQNKGNRKDHIDAQISEEELTVIAMSYIISNKIFQIDSFELGVRLGRIQDYASFCKYYDIRSPNEKLIVGENPRHPMVVKSNLGNNSPSHLKKRKDRQISPTTLKLNLDAKIVETKLIDPERV